MSTGSQAGYGAAVVPLLVLAAAVLHAVWNALAHRIEDKLVGFVLIDLGYLCCAAVLVCFTPLPDAAAWPFIGTSCLLQIVYQVLLLQSYRLGDFGQMYPIARGTSPLLVALASTTVLGQSLPLGGALGLIAVCSGLAGLAFADGLPGRAQLPALAAAVGTGVMIASYTVVDGTGVRRSGTVLGYIAWSFLCQGPALPLAAWRLRGGRALLGALRPAYRTGLAGGALSMLAYGLVVWAQDRGNLAAIAALRETSIVFAALIGALVFRERLGYRRMAASAAVLLGIGVLELAHL
ncbi:EamA family transporter [Streptacidiphilus sp. P02-A3a]|uniref:EamA family transporter n=1 Tax=Streptacidiphilus sp. P02-A3a TaxID=2704468 RepID=UPI0015FE4C20|nr:EamA family transporter [Streptacidiphilus sp. P02-A3a]QMU70979.1 EamA family transporter [Streptacidiphilus sp. P02-A3a]